MSQVVAESANSLHAELRTLIASSRQRLAGAVNAELTRLYWTVGQRLRTEVLGDARASYGTQLLDHLGQQLAQEFGRGFESRNLRRMVKFAESFPGAAIVSTLSTKLSWSHMVAIVAFLVVVRLGVSKSWGQIRQVKWLNSAKGRKLMACAKMITATTEKPPGKHPWRFADSLHKSASKVKA